jgi:hypothetical protein
LPLPIIGTERAALGAVTFSPALIPPATTETDAPFIEPLVFTVPAGVPIIRLLAAILASAIVVVLQLVVLFVIGSVLVGAALAFPIVAAHSGPMTTVTACALAEVA